MFMYDWRQFQRVGTFYIFQIQNLIINAHFICKKLVINIFIQNKRENSMQRISIMISSTKPKQYYHYNSIQQINCKPLKNHIQQETHEYHHHPLKKDNLSVASSTRSSNKIDKFNKFTKPYKKFIQKEEKNKNKHKREYREEERYIYSKTIKRNLLPQQIIPKSSKISKIELIYDLMREKSSRLKLTKNSYYRAILIFQIIYELDNKILASKKLMSMICASLCLGTKFECSRNNYLEQIYKVSMQKVTKDDIKAAQQQIVQILSWKIPVNVFVEQEINELLSKWNQYAYFTTYSNINNKNNHIKLSILWQQQSMRKLYIQMMQILDFIMIRKSQQLLKHSSIKMPFLISIYIILSRSNGDFQLKHYTWSIFETFLLRQLCLSQEKIYKLKVDISAYFIQQKLGEVMSKMPLNINYSMEHYKPNEQFYLLKIEEAI